MTVLPRSILRSDVRDATRRTASLALAGSACVGLVAALTGCFGSSSSTPTGDNPDGAILGAGDAGPDAAAEGIADAGAAIDARATGSDASATDGGIAADAMAAAPGPGACVPTGSMQAVRSFLYSGSLPSGKVLVAGGGSADVAALATAEVYDPATGTFSPTGSMSFARQAALPNSMVALDDGRMLIAGGHDATCTYLSSAEIYDPAAGTWSSTGSMTTPRDNAMAVKLGNGQVLVSGGYATTGAGCTGVTVPAQMTAEIYDPAAGTFALTGNPLSARAAGAVTLMADGSALFVDGEDLGNSPFNGTAEIYTPSSDGGAAGGSFTAAGTPPGAAGYAYAFPLPSGKVLVKTSVGPNGVVSLYDPASNAFTTQGVDPVAAPISCGIALTSGNVFVAGGPQAEVYQASTGTWQVLGSMVTNRTVCGIAELPNGNVLVVGGIDPSGASLATAEVCNPRAASADGG